jgi:uncharacterized protein with GYD domain
MSLYGVYGEHTIADCPLNKKESRELVYKAHEQLKAATEAVGAKIVSQYHSGLEHTWIWVFESPDAQRLEQLMIQTGVASFNSCKIVPLTRFDELAEKLKELD